MKTVLLGLMRSRRGFRGGALALVATVIAVFAAAPPSSAAADNYLDVCGFSQYSCQTGVKVAGPVGECLMTTAYYHSTIVCIDYDGDFVYVKDNQADGYSALGQVWSQYGVAERYCRNTHGNGSWARCNFDWREDGTKKVRGGVRYNDHEWRTGPLWEFSGK
ncbi:hypothetical protein [Micromonospora sp. NBC_01638]|uniref:hypothetical protein n=1 Tax=Micromonospora sp. NBC_01638 TaxID=2975982 RepID=UPI00386376A6|nr:hypothetical protein OG811_30970 [Micromonospora sp. NBC_01638]